MTKAKTIAEYAIKKWIEENFNMKYMELSVKDNQGILKDKNGDTLVLVYDGEDKNVYVKE